MNKNVIKFLNLILIVIISFGCVQKDGKLSLVSLGRVTGNIRPARVTAISVAQNQVIIKGSGFNNINNVSMNNSAHSFSEDLVIESKSDSQIVANGKKDISFLASLIYDLVLSSAEASSTFSVNFSLCDGTLGGVGFTCTAPNDKEVLSYDASSGKWKPRAVNGLNYQGLFSAASGVAPTSTSIGDYYIVNGAGTIAGVNYSNGDWIVYSAVGDWERINNSTAITSVFGRTGAVVANKGDYDLNLLTDVDLRVAPTDGQFLKYNSATAKWIAGSYVYTETDPTVKSFAKSTLPICTTGQVLKSDGTSLSCVTDTTGAPAFVGTASKAVVTDGTGTLSTSAATSTELGYLTGATSNIQTQLGSKLNTSTFVDWSAVNPIFQIDLSHINLGSTNVVATTDSSGKLNASSISTTKLGYLSGVTSDIQTQINSLATPTSINLGAGNADKVLITSGSGQSTVSTVTSTELGFLSGVTSSIQTQLNSATGTWTLPTPISPYIYTTRNVSIGKTTLAGAMLDVSGDALINGLRVGVGGSAGAVSLSTSGNSAFGYSALSSATSTSTNNTAIGFNSLKNNLTGANNTAIGNSALYNNKYNNDSTAIGNRTMYYLEPSGGIGVDVSTHNTAIGSYAMEGGSLTPAFNTGSANTAVGFTALQLITSGINNTAIGDISGQSVSGGTGNTLVGANTFVKDSTSNENTAVGLDALRYALPTFGKNTSVGAYSLVGDVNNNSKNTGSYNTAIGHSALRSNTTGSDNTSIGEFSLTKNTDGYNNTVIGSDAAQKIDKGHDNTVIGYNAQGSSTNSSDRSYTVVIGANNNASLGDNEISISDGFPNERIRINKDGFVGVGKENPSYRLDVAGDLGVDGCIHYGGGQAGTACFSDNRLKKDIHKILFGLDSLLGINPVYYKYNGLGGMKDKEEQMGFIAQDVQKFAPELVVKKKVKLNETDKLETELLAVNYNGFIFMAINAIKDLYNKYVHPMFENDKIQDRKIASLEAENKALKEYICEKDPKAKLCQNKK
jgi:hypothetical protein